MKIELDAKRFSEGIGDFDVGHILTDAEGSEIEIVNNHRAFLRWFTRGI